jgi:hypothetical protein
MPVNQYSWLSFLKKIAEFFRYFISFLRAKKENESQKQKEKFDRVVSETKTNYDNIDKEKEAQKQDDIDKRLKNLF